MFLRSAHVQETICAWYHLLWDVLYATSCSYHAPTPLSTTGFDPRLHRLPRGDASGPRTCIGWGGLGRFELAPPPCFPQHSTVGTPRGEQPREIAPFERTSRWRHVSKLRQAGMAASDHA
eukprot:scaffold324_cov326-Pavlova_lutheri.AAC.8